MRKDKPSTLYASQQIFHEIGDEMRNGTKHKNADNYKAFKTYVETQIDKYDNAIGKTPIELEKLTPLWPGACEQKATAFNMYSTSREQIQKLRNDLKAINGNGKVYKCPLCGAASVYHLDHYVPRSIMPEFSVMPQNLIYLCKDCNEIKDNKWLDARNQRVIFNVYYDHPSGLEVLLCVINTEKDGFPYAEIIENTTLAHTPESLLELNTYKELDIIERYESLVNEALQSECISRQLDAEHRKANGMSIDDIWNEFVSIYSNALSNPRLSVINQYLYKGLISSPIMKDWIDRNS